MHSFTNRAAPINYLVSDTEPVKVLINSSGVLRRPQFDMHFGFEFGIVLEGTVRRYYPGYTHLVRAGQGWFCGMWEPHGWEVVKAPRKVMVFIIWPPLLAQLRFNEAPELQWMAPFILKPAYRPQLDVAKRNILFEKAVHFEKLIKMNDAAQKVRARIFLLDVLSLFLERSCELKSNRDYPQVEHWDKLNHVLRLVFENNAFINTKQAAQECGFHRNVFSQLFKQWMGIKFAEFTLSYRLKQSADRLLTGCDSIKAIARQWGFTDASHYHRAFHACYHCSPSQFRKKHGAP